MITLKEAREPCKGWFYRGKVNRYVSKNGDVVRDDRRLVKLKRMSCEGCENCHYNGQLLAEECQDNMFSLPYIRDGALYALGFEGGEKVWTAWGYEYGSPEAIFTEVDQ